MIARCYNCGEFANHIAAKCTMGPQPKRCHYCKSEDHLIADCSQRPEKVSDLSSLFAAVSFVGGVLLGVTVRAELSSIVDVVILI